MRFQRTHFDQRPFFARTPRSFGVFLLVRLSQAFAVVVLATAALLGFYAFAEPAESEGRAPEARLGSSAPR